MFSEKGFSLYNKITIVEKPHGKDPCVLPATHYYGLHAPRVKCDLRFTGRGTSIYIYIYLPAYLPAMYDLDDPAVATCTTDYYQLSFGTLDPLLYYGYYYYTPRNNIITCNFYFSAVFLPMYRRYR